MKIIACISQDWKLVPASETPMDDKQRFAALTAGGHCWVGRKTWEELPEGMKNGSAGRRYSVLTRTLRFHNDVSSAVPRVDFIYTPDDWCIGGMEVYRHAWHYSKWLYLSILHRDVAGAPFPSLGTETWERILNQEHASHVFQIFRRR